MNAACRRYLAGRNDTLWGRAFDISDTDGEQTAAKWLTTQVMNVLERMPSFDPDGRPMFQGVDL